MSLTRLVLEATPLVSTAQAAIVLVPAVSSIWKRARLALEMVVRDPLYRH